MLLTYLKFNIATAFQTKIIANWLEILKETAIIKCWLCSSQNMMEWKVGRLQENKSSGGIY